MLIDLHSLTIIRTSIYYEINSKNNPKLYGAQKRQITMNVLI